MAAAVAIGAAVVLSAGCVPLGGATQEEGQSQFLVIYCSTEQGRADLRAETDAGISFHSGSAAQGMIDKLEAASRDLRDKNLKWPRGVDRADLAEIASQFDLDARGWRSVLDGGATPRGFGDVSNHAKFAFNRVTKALDLKDPFRECSLR